MQSQTGRHLYTYVTSNAKNKPVFISWLSLATIKEEKKMFRIGKMQISSNECHKMNEPTYLADVLEVRDLFTASSRDLLTNALQSTKKKIEKKIWEDAHQRSIGSAFSSLCFLLVFLTKFIAF